MEQSIINYLKIYNEMPIFTQEEEHINVYLSKIKTEFSYKLTDNLDKIKKRIHSIFHSNKECLICNENNLGITERVVTCSVCLIRICEKCFIKTIKLNKGQRICSFCKDTNGDKINNSTLSFVLKHYEVIRNKSRREMIKENIIKKCLLSA